MISTPKSGMGELSEARQVFRQSLGIKLQFWVSLSDYLIPLRSFAYEVARRNFIAFGESLEIGIRVGVRVGEE